MENTEPNHLEKLKRRSHFSQFTVRSQFEDWTKPASKLYTARIRAVLLYFLYHPHRSSANNDGYHGVLYVIYVCILKAMECGTDDTKASLISPPSTWLCAFKNCQIVAELEMRGVWEYPRWSVGARSVRSVKTVKTVKHVERGWRGFHWTICYELPVGFFRARENWSYLPRMVVRKVNDSRSKPFFYEWKFRFVSYRLCLGLWELPVRWTDTNKRLWIWIGKTKDGATKHYLIESVCLLFMLYSIILISMNVTQKFIFVR